MIFPVSNEPGGQSPVSHRGGPDSIFDQSLWNVMDKAVLGHVFSSDLGFPVLCIILPMFQSNAPSDIGKHWKEKQPLPNKNQVWLIKNLIVYEINTRNSMFLVYRL